MINSPTITKTNYPLRPVPIWISTEGTIKIGELAKATTFAPEPSPYTTEHGYRLLMKEEMLEPEIFQQWDLLDDGEHIQLEEGYFIVRLE